MSVATSQYNVMSLSGLLRDSGSGTGSFVEDPERRIDWLELLKGSVLYSRGDELQGRSVLIAVQSQLATISALMELDGIAQRVVLCPPDLQFEHLPYVIDTAQVDGIVTDQVMEQLGKPRSLLFSALSRHVLPREEYERTEKETEWILMTSGTTGVPKLVAHTLASLTAAIQPRGPVSTPVLWSTFYDVRRYGGLQILLRAVRTGASLVLPDAAESTGDFLARAASSGVTHISGTPSHWRRALMSPAANLIKPKYVRLSGEAIDQAVLNNLKAAYPEARIVHAFASTEAGVAFEVTDGCPGFPEDILEANPSVDMRVHDDTLQIRSAGTASRYLGDNAPVLKDQDGFVDTNDLLELRDGRYYFAGRRDGVINVGGLKVYPEQIEAVISRHPDVQMCVVRAQKNRITGALVVAEVVLRKDCTPIEHDEALIQADILQLCREQLPAYKVPALINIVPMLGIGGAGKVLRRNA